MTKNMTTAPFSRPVRLNRGPHRPMRPTTGCTTITHWTREQAGSIKATAANTFPEFDNADVKTLVPDMDIWDTWLVLDEYGNVADVCGFTVLMALGQPLDRSYASKVVYFYSKDDEHYVYGGHMFPERLVAGAEEWSGCTILRRDGLLQTFYTLTDGRTVNGMWESNQRIATAIQDVTLCIDTDTNEDALVLEAPLAHNIILQPDGQLYQTPAQSNEMEAKNPNQHNRSAGNDQPNNCCFRDPKFFRDPASGIAYLLFEANTGSAICPEAKVQSNYVSRNPKVASKYKATIDALKANGCVGIAVFRDRQFRRAQFLPPIMTTNLVTDEIERINVIFREGSYYLYFVSHTNKMAVDGEDMINRDLLLGFRSRSLTGPYTPLNGNGVVIQQKSPGGMYQGQETNPQYVYSWLVLPDDTVLSYANFATTPQGEVKKIRTAGPTATLDIRGSHSKITGLIYDIQPAD